MTRQTGKFPAGTRLEVVDDEPYAGGGGKRKKPPFTKGAIVTLSHAATVTGPNSSVALRGLPGLWKWLRFRPVEA